MLQKMPTSKKSLLLFRAISDTASDGQLGILAHVGIEIDLSNSNLAFLLRRIQNRSEPLEIIFSRLNDPITASFDFFSLSSLRAEFEHRSFQLSNKPLDLRVNNLSDEEIFGVA